MNGVAKALAESLNDQEMAQLNAFLSNSSVLDDDVARQLYDLRLVEQPAPNSELTISRLGIDVLSRLRGT